MLAILILQTCDQTEGNGFVAFEVDSIEDAEQLIASLNFVGELPNGQIVDFRLGGYETLDQPGSNFTEAPTTNYIEEKSLIINAAEFVSNPGILRLDFASDMLERTVTFPYVYVSTLAELALRFPNDISINPTFRNFIYGVGIADESLTIEDLVEADSFFPSNYVIVSFNPSINSTQNAGFYLEVESSSFFELVGNASFINRTIESEGNLRELLFNSVPIVGSYQLVLSDTF